MNDGERNVDGEGTQSSLDDENLRCLSCGYSLTGLAGDRCPECGAGYDIKYLRGIQAGEVRRILSLERLNEIGVFRALLCTAYESCIHPMRSAGALPPNPCGISGWFYSACCYGVAIAFFAFAIIGSTFPPAGDELLVMLVAWLVFLALCEFVLAGLLSITCRRGRFYPHRVRFYRALVHLGSIHTVGLAATYYVSRLVIDHFWGGVFHAPVWAEFLMLLPLITVGLWIIHLGALVAGLGESLSRVLLVPVLAAVSAIAAWIPLAFVGYLFSHLAAPI